MTSAAGSASQPLVAIDATPTVDYRFFLLADSMAYDVSPLEHPPTEPNSLLGAGQETVVLHSAGTDFKPEVRLEIWDRDPGTPAGQWDLVEMAVLNAPSGRVRIDSPDWECAAEIAVPSTSLRVRAACRGRQAVSEAVASGAYDFVGIEIWLIQVWPN